MSNLTTFFMGVSSLMRFITYLSAGGCAAVPRLAMRMVD